MLKRLVIPALLALSWSTQASADCINVGDGRLACTGAISIMYSVNGDIFQFAIAGSNVPSNPACLPPAGTYVGWWTFPRNHALYREWLSMLLSAAATGSTVQVSSTAASAGQACVINRIELLYN